MLRRLFVTASFVTVFGSPALCQAQALPDNDRMIFTSVAASTFAAPALAIAEGAAMQAGARPAVFKPRSDVASTTVLTSLYATTAAMQMLDVDSTLKSLNKGAIETNPLMTGLVKNRTVFLATKAGIAAATIYAANRMARHNKLGAIVTLVAINSAYAMIVNNNYKIARR